MKNEYGLEVVNIRLVKEQTQYSDKPAESPKQAVEIVGGKALLEASGNLTKERIKSVAELGIDIGIPNTLNNKNSKPKTADFQKINIKLAK